MANKPGKNQVVHLEAGRELLIEEPLSIRVDGKPYVVVMRTPGDELAQASGFALTEGLIDSRDDLTSLGLCEGDTANVVTLTLTGQRREKVAGLLDRQHYLSQTACGLCGKEMVDELFQDMAPLENGAGISRQRALEAIANLSRLQPLRKQTKASHAAALFSRNFELLAVGEDVGRHNALDKAVGQAMLDGSLNRAQVTALSSRVSYEMAQKAIRAGTPIILSLARPTALAVEIGLRLNLTIALLLDDTRLHVYCGEHRFID